jgi:hypothetical protein
VWAAEEAREALKLPGARRLDGDETFVKPFAIAGDEFGEFP